MYIYIYLNGNIYESTYNYLFKYIYPGCYLKFRCYYPSCSAVSNLNSADFTTPNSHQRF